MKKIALLLLSLVLPFVVLAAQKQPNIVVIVADDISPMFVGAYGGATPTPNIDRLAEEGVRFDQAYAVTPLCNPSRYTLLTGQYPGRNPKLANTTPAGEPYHMMQSTDWTREDPSIARMLSEAGYYTGYVGKWHSNFEVVLKGLGMENKLSYDDPEADKKLAEVHAYRVSQIAKETGFDFVANLQIGNLHGGRAKQIELGYHNPEFQTLGALEFLEEAKAAGKPFFLHLANSIPHGPDNMEALRQDARYTHKGKLDKTTTELAGHPPREQMTERLRGAGLDTKGPLASNNAGMIVLDDQVRIVRQKLEQLGMAENTIIIWLADHSIYGKGVANAPGLLVPMIMSGTDQLPTGKVVDKPISLVDLFKTCAELADAELPDDTLDGESLMPLINGATQEHTLPYIEAAWHRGIIKGKYQFIAFRPSQEAIELMKSGKVDHVVDWMNPRWDYQHNFANLNIPYKPTYFDPDQLYDLEADPFTRTNLAYVPGYEEIVQEMKHELAKVTETFERPFPVFDVDPFMKTMQYRDLVSKRFQVVQQEYRDFKGYDGEAIFNLNLKDPTLD